MHNYESPTSYPTTCIYSGDGRPWFILEFGVGLVSLIMVSLDNPMIKAITIFLIISIKIWHDLSSTEVYFLWSSIF